MIRKYMAAKWEREKRTAHALWKDEEINEECEEWADVGGPFATWGHGDVWAGCYEGPCLGLWSYSNQGLC